jgi:hypothetical protein
MPHGPRSTLVLAAVATLLLAGCGSQKSTSKSRMISRADAICQPLNAQRKAGNKSVGAVTGIKRMLKIAQIAPGLATSEHRAVAELRALTAPAALAATWQQILAGTQQLADNTVKLGAYAKVYDLKHVESVIHSDQQSERALAAIATKAGFKHCGRTA